MTNEEYINQHPEQFKDDIDKWLFTEFGIIGGCCSAEKSHEYSVARIVAEKLTDAIIEKVENYLNSKLYDWVQTTNPNQRSCANIIMKQDFIEDFKNYMKGE